MTPPDHRFKCPSCGGSSFGSVLEVEDPKGSMRRYCHGNDAGDGRRGCHFTFPDREDWMYFSVNGKKLNQVEYAAAMEELRKIPFIGGDPTWPE